MGVAELVIFAILVEAITENLTTLIADGKLNKKVLASLVIAIVVALAGGFNIFAILGLELAVPFLGEVLTGVLGARGANYMSDLLKRLNGGSQKVEETK